MLERKQKNQEIRFSGSNNAKGISVPENALSFEKA